VLLYCHAGCKTEDVLAAVGLTWADTTKDRAMDKRIVASYPYVDEHGVVLYEVLRYEPKDFRQRRMTEHGWEWQLGDVRRVLYHLPELLSSKPRMAFVVEGERDVESLERLGCIATTNAGGAGKWRPEYSASLAGRHVVILPDNDEPGQRHAELVRDSLTEAASIKIVKLPGLGEKADVSDWLVAGNSRDILAALIKETPSVKPQNRDDRIRRRLKEIEANLGSICDALSELTELLGRN
jgi:nucleoside diphosphate kinase